MSGKKIDKHFVRGRGIQVDPINEAGEPCFHCKDRAVILSAGKAKNTQARRCVFIPEAKALSVGGSIPVQIDMRNFERAKFRRKSGRLLGLENGTAAFGSTPRQINIERSAGDHFRARLVNQEIQKR